MHSPPPPNALPEIRTAPPGPKSRALLGRLEAVESPGVTYMADDFPVVWHSARGSAVVDVDGNRYLDGGASFGVCFIGHGHPRVVAALQAQSELLLHGMGDVHPPRVRVELLEALAVRAPGDLGAGVLCTGGSEAVEVALKTTWLATGRPGVIAFDGGYHGLATGALEVTARSDFRQPFAPLLAGNARFVPYPRAPLGHGVLRGPSLAEVCARIEALIASSDGDRAIGAIIVEPIQGRGGSMLPDAGLLPELRRICDAHDLLLIADEIFTGCGRTGDMFACEASKVVPDLLCVGKALGGGMPISACLGRPHVMAAWGRSTGEALHTSTFLGHPMACAAALETLRVIDDEDLLAVARAKGERLQRRLQTGLGDLPGLVEVRGRGLMIGVEWSAGPEHGAGDRVLAAVGHCLRSGLLVLPCGPDASVLQLTPAATIAPAQLDALADIVIEAFVAGSA